MQVDSLFYGGVLVLAGVLNGAILLAGRYDRLSQKPSGDVNLTKGLRVEGGWREPPVALEREDGYTKMGSD